jgi:hypothetical protein
MTSWEMDLLELVNCNCAFGCPCQFNSLPTHGNCEAAIGFHIVKGHYGATKLDGVKAAMTCQWPGAIHQGNGTIQLIVDSGATVDQRHAVESIFTGGDTDDMATFFWVFNKMSPNRLETLVKPIEISIDPKGRKGHVRVPGVFETDAEPVRNPVTGAEMHARIDLPKGFEFRVAEIASGTTKTSGAISLKKNKATHAHLAKTRLSGHGVMDNVV